MKTGKEAEPRTPTTRESEVFRDPPGGGNYSSSAWDVEIVDYH